MANSIATPTVVAKEALRILNNNLVMAKRCSRVIEMEYGETVNGYKKGATVMIRRPTQFTVRSGNVAAAQDVVEGQLPFSVNKQIGADLSFSTLDLTLSMNQLSERVIKPAMIRLANQIDQDCHSAAKNGFYNWVGTPGTNISSFAGFVRAPQRMDEIAIPSDSRSSILSPADYYAMLGSFTALTAQQGVATDALRQGYLGKVASCDTYETANVVNHTVGTKAGAGAVNGAGQVRTWAGDVTVASNNISNVAQAVGGNGLLVKDLNQQTLVTNGWTASSAILNQGDIFTIAGVFSINPVTKAVLPYLQQFVVNAGASSDGGGAATINISPAIITAGAFQSVSAAPAGGALMTVLGTASTAYAQNLFFHREAMNLAVVPMEIAPGSPPGTARESFDGLSVKVTPGYDWTNDKTSWRLDILYGVLCTNNALGVRASG